MNNARIALCVVLALASQSSVFANTVDWTGNSPTSGNWTQGANWSAPPQAGDDLIFGTTNNRTTNFDDIDLTISTLTFEENGPAFTIHVLSSLTVSGTAGLVNKSTNQQTLVNEAGHVVNPGSTNPMIDAGVITFTHSAGTTTPSQTRVSITNLGSTSAEPYSASLQFQDMSSAQELTITNQGAQDVVGPTATGGVTTFYAQSTAANANIINAAGTDTGSGGPHPPVLGGKTVFTGTSTAGRAVINNLSNGAGAAGSTTFQQGASASDASIFNSGGMTVFTDSAIGGRASIFNQAGTGGIFGSTTFQSSVTNGFVTASSADHASIENQGGMTFFTGYASAGNASIRNEFLGAAGQTVFSDFSTAENAVVANDPGTSTTFLNSATAGSAIITSYEGNLATSSSSDGGRTIFNDSSTAGNATITARAGRVVANIPDYGGRIIFTGSADGGTARVIVTASNDGPTYNGIFDISQLTTSGMGIGSIEGAGTFSLGSKNLTTGKNDLDTEVSGTIGDGGLGGGTGGSLTKVGTGTLILSGTNTYTGGTTVSAGTLLVDGSIRGNTLVQNGAIIGGHGTIGNGGTSALTVNSGGTLSPGNSPGILHIDGTLDMKLGSTYLVELNGMTAGTQYDQTQITGNLLLNHATLTLQLGFTPLVGEQFTIMTIDGSHFASDPFNGLAQNSQFTSGGDTFTISYTGGDGNDIVLTTVAVPEPGSVLLVGLGVAMAAFFRCGSRLLLK